MELDVPPSPLLLLLHARCDAQGASLRKCERDRFGLPTLRQAWPREYPRPQYAFKMSMFNVSCNSH